MLKTESHAFQIVSKSDGTFLPFIIQSVLTRLLAELQPQAMTEPQPCLTDGCGHSLLYLSTDLC